MDPDPGGPKTYGSVSATLPETSVSDPYSFDTDPDPAF
jgi:hypothetical protein